MNIIIILKYMSLYLESYNNSLWNMQETPFLKQGEIEISLEFINSYN